jgi:predicted methyltransferase
MKRARKAAQLTALVCLLVPILPAQYRERQTAAERDKWQHPEQVMDALGLHAGSRVADVGAGPGYFTVHLAERVGATGKVYAVDVDRAATRKLRERMSDLGLKQVQVVDGEEDDPHLPPGELDAILVVNAYHEFRQHDAMLRAFMRALKPGGRLGIIEKADKPGRERSSYESAHRLPENFVREDLARNGFAGVREQPGFDPTDADHAGEHWYFLLTEKAAARSAPAASNLEHAGIFPAD